MAGPTGPTKSAEGRSLPSAGRPSPTPRRPTPPPPPSARRGPRPRPRWPGARALPLALVLVVLFGGFGVWVLYGSSWLRVGHVSVKGAQVLTESQVRSAARIPVGDPVSSVDTAAAERRLRAALPRLSRAEAVRAWPDGISLQVTERQPQLAIEKAGEYSEVDAQGVRFATVDKLPDGVPLLAMDLQHSAGVRYFGAHRLRREAVRIASALPPAVARSTHTVRVRSYDSVTLELTGGRTVLWGSGERSAAKARSLTALLKAAEGARHFDVSVPQAPAASGS